MKNLWAVLQTTVLQENNWSGDTHKLEYHFNLTVAILHIHCLSSYLHLQHIVNHHLVVVYLVQVGIKRIEHLLDVFLSVILSILVEVVPTSKN